MPDEERPVTMEEVNSLSSHWEEFAPMVQEDLEDQGMHLRLIADWRSMREALKAISKSSCALTGLQEEAPPCPKLEDDPEEWCESCTARVALGSPIHA